MHTNALQTTNTLAELCIRIMVWLFHIYLTIMYTHFTYSSACVMISMFMHFDQYVNQSTKPYLNLLSIALFPNKTLL